MESTQPQVLVMVPHQDDELLIMGPAIRNATSAGRDVRVVLFGLGDGTIVRTRDMPDILGRTPSPEEIGRVRDAEFRRSSQLLGVLEHHVEMARPRQPEKRFTSEASREVMEASLDAHPGSELWTVSEFDANPDHAALGLAARELARAGRLTNERATMFVAPWCRGRFPHPPLHPERAPLGYREQQPYRYTDVDADRWGVGRKSVRSYFRAQLADPVCYRYNLHQMIEN